MPSGLLYAPVDDYATLGYGLGSDPRYDEGLTGKRDGENEASITVTRPRRSSFSSDRHKSPVMTDRRRSDPSDALVQPPCHQPPRENVKGLEKRRERIARRASSLSRRGRTDGRARRKRFVIANDLCRCPVRVLFVRASTWLNTYVRV